MAAAAQELPTDVPKVLVTEELAERGLDLMREHYEVEVAAGLPREDLLKRVKDADALVIRSATQVDAELIAAASQLKVVGRAGIGLDNVDVDAATKRGILVVNAPQSNVVSAAEHTLALLLAEARNVARADSSLRAGRWERSQLQGVELFGKTLGVLGLGRVGGLVAERAAAFGMRIVAYDPFVSDERARQLGVELLDAVDEVLAQADFLTIHLPRTPETEGLIGGDAIAKMRDGVRIVNTARGGIVDESALAEAIRAGKVAGAGIDVYDVEPKTDSPLFDVPEAVVTPHLGASTVEAQDRAGITIAEQVVLALSGEFVPYAVNVEMGREVSDLVRQFLSVGEALGRFFAAYAGGLGESVEIEHAGEIAAFDCKALTLSVLKGLFARAVIEPVTFVNAPLLAEERGIEVRETTTPKSLEYKSLITVKGSVGGRDFLVAGTLYPIRDEARIVSVLDYEIELPLSRHMAMISNDDRPGVIGRVGTVLGEAEINIDDMVVGRHRAGDLALMGINLADAVPSIVQDRIKSSPGIIEARFLEL